MENTLVSLSVVIPVYNEGEFIAKLVDVTKKELVKTEDTFEIILVDDGSQDNTWEIITDIAKIHCELRAVSLSRNYGKEYALSAGLDSAQGSAVVIMDGDLQHPPVLIPEMVRLWRDSKADIVEAVKRKRGAESVINKIGANVFYSIMFKLTGYDLEGASDFKLMDRKVVNALQGMRERNLFFRGMSAWVGFRRVRVLFDVQERIGGKTRWSIIQLIRLAVGTITSFSSLPLHLISLMGYLFLFFVLLFGVYSFILKFSGVALTGFTTVNLLLLIIGSLLMISLGIIGEYVAKIYDEVKNRPRYIVSDRIR